MEDLAKRMRKQALQEEKEKRQREKEKEKQQEAARKQHTQELVDASVEATWRAAAKNAKQGIYHFDMKLRVRETTKGTIKKLRWQGVYAKETFERRNPGSQRVVCDGFRVDFRKTPWRIILVKLWSFTQKLWNKRVLPQAKTIKRISDG